MEVWGVFQVARRVVGAAAGMPDNPDLEYSHNTAAKDCFLMMAFSQVRFSDALPPTSVCMRPCSMGEALNFCWFAGLELLVLNFCWFAELKLFALISK